MKTDRQAESLPDPGIYYQIRVRGRIDLHWASWFEGLEIEHEASGDTTLTGRLVDQAALYGLISKIRDLGLELLAVTRQEPPLP